MFCSKCGAQVTDGAKFCPVCGNPMDAQQVPAPAPQPVQQPQVPAQPQQPVYQQQAYQQQAYQQPGQAYNAAYQQPMQQPVAQTSAYGAAPAMGFGPVETNYSLVSYILLNLVTCNIYSYYIIYKMAQDSNKICTGDGKGTMGLVGFICLSFITCGIYAWYWEYKLQERLRANAPRYGMQIQQSGAVVLAWIIGGAVVGGLLCIPVVTVWLGYIVAVVANAMGINILFKTLNILGGAYNRMNGYIC